MKPFSILALAALAAPVAFAQTYYYPPSDSPLAREELRRCMDRDETLASRQAAIETERRLNEREGQSIARAGAVLAEELRRLDPADAAATAAYNARSADHNRRVEAHNLRVEDHTLACSAPETTLDALLKEVSRHTVLDFECAEAELEETFLTFYTKEAVGAS